MTCLGIVNLSPPAAASALVLTNDLSAPIIGPIASLLSPRLEVLMSMIVARPTADEYAASYATYVDKVGKDADILRLLADQEREFVATLTNVAPPMADFRYAPAKWSVKEVVGHLTDSERVFAYRLLRIARGDATPLAGFEEDDYVRAAEFDRLSLPHLTADWQAVRRATRSLADGLDAAAWSRLGVANGKRVSARALAFVIAGHLRHHFDVLIERYGLRTVP